MFIGAGARQYVGSVNVDTEEGNDRLVIGHLEGNTSGTGDVFHLATVGVGTAVGVVAGNEVANAAYEGNCA